VALKSWWLIVLALFFTIVALEEINWGQTYFHFSTPEILAKANVHHELNLHNIPAPFLSGGKVHSTPNWSDYLFIALAVSFGAIIPLLIYICPPIEKFAWASEAPLPSKIVQLGFIIAAIIPLDNTMIGDFSRNNIPSELREITCAVCFFLFMRHLRYKNNDPSKDNLTI